MPKPVAVICSDLHMHYAPPIKRIGDWQGDMEKSLSCVSRLANKHRVPVICCGDLFHAAQEPPSVELMMLDFINGISYGFYSIPGQHDMKHHRKDLEGTSYRLIQKAVQGAARVHVCDDVTYLNICSNNKDMDINMWLVPWGMLNELPDIAGRTKAKEYLGLIAHELTFTESFPNSLEVSDWFNNYPDFDFFIVGDNHKTFLRKHGNRFFLSPGSLMNRATDQADRKPFVYLMYSDLSLKRVANEHEKEVQFQDAVSISHSAEVEKFCGAFDQNDHDRISFYHALQARRLKEPKGRVREILDELEGMLK